MKRRYTDADNDPHGTRELIRYFIQDQPDTRRRYGRRLIRGIAAGCDECQDTDRRDARLSRIRAAYRRRTR
ncbi:hypothetical protein FHR83_007031 [Actinoplanes campanulatus]|uniref:Uncharacterized protein n=1 Tax=Actinoplanes campanulatus TaxID=113559 RepID=A0A7W5FIC5_9ACTN|nr:hypothetical protein [Actinoplanes campanulatus]MBB3099325.1 hypothetical protein [Actinoplanes campanulatus]GGN40467.1 hypothetical protein GCM10010109_69600 [Actinoplanes campanulatus]GID40643.1 hypothetical protein Aca09nite_71490 [Actinoplanes campanulatus]